MKNRKYILYISFFICIFSMLFIGLLLEKPLSYKAELTSTPVTVTSASSVKTASTELNPITELTPNNLKHGTEIFSDSELSPHLEQKKEILNSSVLSPKKTEHPILDKLVEQRFSEPLAECPDTFSKAMYCYDWLVENCTFGGGTVHMQDMYVFLGDCDYDGTDGTVVYDAYRILLTGQGVCDNYASALTVLYRYIGLEAYTVHGKAVLADETLMNHVWVAVKIGDEFYFFDPQVENAASKNGACTYALFCVDADELSYCTAYDLEKSTVEFHEFVCCAPLQAVCSVAKNRSEALSYYPKDVDAYGSVTRTYKIGYDVNNGAVPIEIDICGGNMPYNCTVKVEYVENGQFKSDILVQNSAVDSTLSTDWTPHDDTQAYRIAAEISDATGRNLTCILL